MQGKNPRDEAEISNKVQKFLLKYAPVGKTSNSNQLPKGTNQKKSNNHAQPKREVPEDRNPPPAQVSKKKDEEWDNLAEFWWKYWHCGAFIIFCVIVPYFIDQSIEKSENPKDEYEKSLRAICTYRLLSRLVGIHFVVPWKNVFHQSKTFVFRGGQAGIAVTVILMTLFTIALFCNKDNQKWQEWIYNGLSWVQGVVADPQGGLKGLLNANIASWQSWSAFVDKNFLAVHAGTVGALLFMHFIHRNVRIESVRFTVTALSLAGTVLVIAITLTTPLTWLNQFSCGADVCLPGATDNAWLAFTGGNPPLNATCMVNTTRCEVTGKCVGLIKDYQIDGFGRFNRVVFSLSVAINVLRGVPRLVREAGELGMYTNLGCGLLTVIAWLMYYLDQRTSSFFQSCMAGLADYWLKKMNVKVPDGSISTLVGILNAMRSNDGGERVVQVIFTMFYMVLLTFFAQRLPSSTFASKLTYLEDACEEMTDAQIAAGVRKKAGQTKEQRAKKGSVCWSYVLAASHYLGKNLIILACLQPGYMFMDYRLGTIVIYGVYALSTLCAYASEPYGILKMYLNFIHAFAVCTEVKFYHIDKHLNSIP